MELRIDSDCIHQKKIENLRILHWSYICNISMLLCTSNHIPHISKTSCFNSNTNHNTHLHAKHTKNTISTKYKPTCMKFLCYETTISQIFNFNSSHSKFSTNNLNLNHQSDAFRAWHDNLKKDCMSMILKMQDQVTNCISLLALQLSHSTCVQGLQAFLVFSSSFIL